MVTTYKPTTTTIKPILLPPPPPMDYFFTSTNIDNVGNDIACYNAPNQDMSVCALGCSNNPNCTAYNVVGAGYNPAWPKANSGCCMKSTLGNILTAPNVTLHSKIPIGYNSIPFMDNIGSDIMCFNSINQDLNQCAQACDINNNCVGFNSVATGFNGNWPAMNSGCCLKSTMGNMTTSKGVTLYSKKPGFYPNPTPPRLLPPLPPPPQPLPIQLPLPLPQSIPQPLSPPGYNQYQQIQNTDNGTNSNIMCITGGSASTCQTACTSNIGCYGYTVMSNGQCCLKNSNTNLNYSPGTTFYSSFQKTPLQLYHLNENTDNIGADINCYTSPNQDPNICVVECDGNPACIGYSYIEAGANSSWPNPGCCTKSSINLAPLNKVFSYVKGYA
jgi:hypothetical protein